MADFWMKLHVDIIESRDFARLSDIAWRIYFEMSLLSKKTTNDGTLGSEEDIAWSLRRGDELIHAALLELEEAGFVSKTDSGWKIDDFESTQSATTATERSARFRERTRRTKLLQGKTNQETSCNANATEVKRQENETATERCTNCNETATEVKRQENETATERCTNCNANATEVKRQENETATERCTEKEIELRAEKELRADPERELEGESERETEKSDKPAVLPRESRASRDPALNAPAPPFSGQKDAEEPPPEARMLESAESSAASGKNVDGSGKTQDGAKPDSKPPISAEFRENKSTNKTDRQVTGKLPASTDADAAKPESVKREYGEFQNVRLTDAEAAQLRARFTDWRNRIELLSAWKRSKGRATKSDYATILSWARRDGVDCSVKPELTRSVRASPPDLQREPARPARNLSEYRVSPGQVRLLTKGLTSDERTALESLDRADMIRLLSICGESGEVAAFLDCDAAARKKLLDEPDEKLLTLLRERVQRKGSEK